jgi:hypothetical protein
MKRISCLIPIVLIFILSCAKPPKRGAEIPPELNNVFNASFNQTWSATLAGLEWIKWSPAFTDKNEGTIRLKEAYVYRRSGNLFRAYHWPSIEEAKKSGIDDYLEKVAYYDNSIFNSNEAIISQESMEIRVISLSKSQTKVVINYKIKPYLKSGKFGDQVMSRGYIESLILQRIREKLKGKPIGGNGKTVKGIRVVYGQF